jgi:hypothetical protein
MTETIKVEVDEDLAKRFRKKAMEKYGYKKGAVKKALEGLMEDFARKGVDDKERKPPDWGALVGAIKDDYNDVTSVALQHSIWQMKNDYHGRHKHIR